MSEEAKASIRAKYPELGIFIDIVALNQNQRNQGYFITLQFPIAPITASTAIALPLPSHTFYFSQYTVTAPIFSCRLYVLTSEFGYLLPTSLSNVSTRISSSSYSYWMSSLKAFRLATIGPCSGSEEATQPMNENYLNQTLWTRKPMDHQKRLANDHLKRLGRAQIPQARITSLSIISSSKEVTVPMSPVPSPKQLKSIFSSRCWEIDQNKSLTLLRWFRLLMMVAVSAPAAFSLVREQRAFPRVSLDSSSRTMSCRGTSSESSQFIIMQDSVLPALGKPPDSMNLEPGLSWYIWSPNLSLLSWISFMEPSSLSANPRTTMKCLRGSEIKKGVDAKSVSLMIESAIASPFLYLSVLTGSSDQHCAIFSYEQARP